MDKSWLLEIVELMICSPSSCIAVFCSIIGNAETTRSLIILNERQGDVFLKRLRLFKKATEAKILIYFRYVHINTF